MKTLTILATLIAFTGCAQKPPRPNHYAALQYPYGTVTDISALRYEGKDWGLDGGSRVHIFSTPKKRKVELWELSQLSKKSRGLDPELNAFDLVFGPKEVIPVSPGSEIESMLLRSMPPDLAGRIKDRKKQE